MVEDNHTQEEEDSDDTMTDNGPSGRPRAPTITIETSRPTSPHNVSSPTRMSERQPQNFLAVPSSRSRGNSVDSYEGHSPTSLGSDTYLPSFTSSQHGDSHQRSETQAGSVLVLNDEEALHPDPGTEADFQVENNPFAFSPGQLSKLLNPKNFQAFHAVGGIRGLEKGLRSDVKSGLSVDENQLQGKVSLEEAKRAGVTDFDAQEQTPVARIATSASGKKSNSSFLDRVRVFRDNRLPEKKAKSIFELAWLAYNDKVLILLTIAAIVSLALGIYQSIRPSPTEKGAHVEWVEGVAIVVAILIVVIVGAGNDWQKERQFVKLNKKKEDRNIKVIRSGRSREISVYDVMVGDVMHLEPGDMVPADGIFIEGFNVCCDESTATGESDVLRKTAGEEVFRALEAHEPLGKMDPFIISGARITEGIGTFLVTAVGVNSSHGKILMSLREDVQTTPLQSKLNVLAEQIAKLGLAAGLLLFIVTFIEFLVRLPHTEGGPSGKAQVFLNTLITAVTIVVVAVPEGLPLAVTLALAFATTRMLKDNNLVRRLRACETMGNATTICSDKTGTLTQNKMQVVAGTVSTASRFGDLRAVEAAAASSTNKAEATSTPLTAADSVTPQEFVATLSPSVKEALKQSIYINTSAFEAEDAASGDQFVGSKTETALLTYAREFLGMVGLSEERSDVEIIQTVPFDSGRKCMATAVLMKDGKYRLYVKGASEIMLSRCTRIVRDPTKDLTPTELTSDNTEALTRTITHYASRSLRTLALLYKDFEQWPPKGGEDFADQTKLADFDKIFKEMTFLGIVGIQDPLRPNVIEAVRSCQRANVFVRMVTGDNLLTAQAIATECGIYTEGGIVMEGPVFRRLSRREMNQIIPRLQVLARSSPEDKRILVKRLKELGETVAVTGDGTNDAPALKTADVGFSMGIAGTEVAKEASDIILMDDNFNSIVFAIMWGRAVNDAVKKFLQFQITVNITAVLLTFISGVSSSTETSVLNAVQLLWVNLIMDTFAALALATDPPTPKILKRKPDPKSAPLISLTMWKMIIGQSIYQLAVTLILYYAGASILNYETPEEQEQLRTTIFNAFVFMQIFNQWNCRRLDNGFNIFEGMFRNNFFLGIQLIIIGGQILIVFVGGAAFDVTRIDGAQWGISVILGLISLPVAIVIRLIPDEIFAKILPTVMYRNSKTPSVIISDEEAQYQWIPPLEDIKDELAFLKKVRGGRLNALRWKLQHPREFLPRSRSGSRVNSIPQTPSSDQGGSAPFDFISAPPTPESRRSLGKRSRSRSNSAFGPAAAMAGVIAGSIAGWSPVEKRESEGETGDSAPPAPSSGKP
ncbi:hypothetical protein MMC25_007808 [Agyrium rufum]|nr:hypothetical protein [Agyrium rufum]